jgi:hypothetical protein
MLEKAVRSLLFCNKGKQQQVMDRKKLYGRLSVRQLDIIKEKYEK